MATIDPHLARLVLSLAEGAPHGRDYLQDYLLDHPSRATDLALLVDRAVRRYVDIDASGCIPSRKLERLTEVERMARYKMYREMVERDLEQPNPSGQANACIRQVCREVLNVDHLGRPLDV